MISEKIKIPFSWDRRRPYRMEGLLYLPPLFFSHAHYKALFDLKTLFPNYSTIQIEFCSGNGQWIAEKAQANPQQAWIAVEKRSDRARKIWKKVKDQKLNNVFVVWGEAEVFSKYYLDEDAVNEVYVNFPDPWPKSKHEKHRLLDHSFLSSLKKILIENGSITIATDDKPSALRMIDLFLIDNNWVSKFSAPYYTHSWHEYGDSFFKALWASQNKQIFYLQFEWKKENYASGSSRNTVGL